MAFAKLPIEINTHIASYLSSDRSVARFASICRSTHAAVAHPHSSIWRTRFTQTFDFLPGIPNDVLKAIYQRRMSLLRKGTRFYRGLSHKEKAILVCLKDMIIGKSNLWKAYGGHQGHQDAIARNIRIIESVCRNHDLLENVLAPRYFDKQTSPLMITLQVMLTHLRFSLERTTRTFSFDDAQRMMYKIPEKEPMFNGKNRTEINMRWVLNAFTFFKHYMTSSCAALSDAYEGLDEKERLRPWQQNIGAGVMSIGKCWKGAYAYLKHDEIEAVRDSTSNIELEDRWCDGPELFQTLELDFADQLFPDKAPDHLDTADHHHQLANAARMPWPHVFERHLRSINHPSVHTMQKAKTCALEKAANTKRADEEPRARAEVLKTTEYHAKCHSRTSSAESTTSSIFSSALADITQSDPSSDASLVASTTAEIANVRAKPSKTCALKQQTLNPRVIKSSLLNMPSQLHSQITPKPTLGLVLKATRASARASGPAATKTSSQTAMKMKSPTAPRATRAQTRSVKDLSSPLTAQTNLPRPKLDMANVILQRQFQACGIDEEDFLAAGFITALPSQQGIPGWARFTMMKFFGPADDYDINGASGAALKPPFRPELLTGTDGLWAYEGVMLPGGRVIVGRWWSPETEGRDHGAGVALGIPGGDPTALPGEESIYSGPFMFWCVDD